MPPVAGAPTRWHPGEKVLRAKVLVPAVPANGRASNARPFTRPSWSPWRRLVLGHRMRGDVTLRIVAADGCPTRSIPKLSYPDPAWSPDGTRVAFAGWGRRTARTATPASRSTRETGGLRMTAVSSRPRDLPTRCLHVDSAPSWSPDGTKIAFERAGALWTMGAMGSGKRRLSADTPASYTVDWQRCVPRGPCGRSPLRERLSRRPGRRRPPRRAAPSA